ncbi:BnaC09g21600D [Brassica napus]|uniref:Serine/threonine-protein kinase PRP4 homolog n=1 Tax=Brassica napus TaxID=3708 RepID=A0A078HP56_BRANA|nr:BnaC09g21600D [Brassica napus]
MDVTPIGVSHGGEDDVEEGEILDEEGLANVKTPDSDDESGEIKSDQFQGYHLPFDGVSGARNAETSNGVLTRESERKDKRWYKEYGGPSDRVGKRSDDNGRSSLSLENSESEEKLRARSRSRSHDREREMSRSRLVAADEFPVRGRHHDPSRDYLYDRVEAGRTEDNYYRRGRYGEDDRQYGREILERERSKERDMVREGSIRDKDSERRSRREIEAERERLKDYERERSIDRDRRREWERERRGRSSDRDRRREREDDYVRDRDNERGKSRDRTRYESRERKREKERENDKDRDKGRELKTDTEKYKNVDVDNGERSRNEDAQNDNDEGVIWKSPEEEEEELNRIKEESRKRMEAILEKYKKKPDQQNELSSQDKGKDDVKENGAPDSASSSIVLAANADPAKDNSDIYAIDSDVAKTSLTTGAPPTMFGISHPERTLAPAGLGEGSPKSERSADMFHDDIFGESPAANQKVDHTRGKGDGVPMVRSGLYDNWDDAEGYYSYQFGELIDGRYEVIATHGKGVFSTVVRAKDLKAGPAEPEEVAIKIIRNNETMHKAGQTEVQILKKLAGSDREDKRHCVRFLSSFKYRNHLCLVFESLHLNLREVLKKFGRNIGLKLSAVRSYSKQLFIALKHLKNCGVLHCDIKPDNMLVNENKNVLKLCDFGNAMFAGKNEVTPYLVSRFYRSPEIILGLTYDHPLDIWSVGCCLYELYCGKVLFPGATNNDMLRLHMELKGPFPKKMLRKGAFIDQHFDHDLNFYATEEDNVSGKMMKRMIVNVKPKDFGSIIKGYPGEDPKMLAHFRDLLDKIFILDPEKRLTCFGYNVGVGGGVWVEFSPLAILDGNLLVLLTSTYHGLETVLKSFNALKAHRRSFQFLFFLVFSRVYILSDKLCYCHSGGLLGGESRARKQNMKGCTLSPPASLILAETCFRFWREQSFCDFFLRKNSVLRFLLENSAKRGKTRLYGFGGKFQFCGFGGKTRFFGFGGKLGFVVSAGKLVLVSIESVELNIVEVIGRRYNFGDGCDMNSCLFMVRERTRMILVTSPSVTYRRHSLHNPHTKSLQISCQLRRSSQIPTVDLCNPRQTMNGFQIRTRDRSILCLARRKPEAATVEVEDDPLQSILRYLLWTAEAVYILWLFLLPYAPGDPVWAISSETVNSLLGLSLNFFFILPLTNSVGIHVLEAPVLHPMAEGLFNFVIAWTLMFAPLLYTDRKRDRFKSSLDVLWGLMMFLTNTFLIPYMAIRLNDADPDDKPSKRSQLGEAMTKGASVVGLTGATVCLISTLWSLYGRADGGFGGIMERWQYLIGYLGSERLAYAFIWDICLYTVFQPWLIGENLQNVKKSKVELVRYLRFVPVLGLLAYLLSLNLDD